MRKVTVRLKHHLIKNLKVFKTVYVRNVAEVSTLYFIANSIFALTFFFYVRYSTGSEINSIQNSKISLLI